MPETVISLTPVEIAALQESMQQGPILSLGADGSGQRFLGEAQVDKFDGLRVDVFADEHPPPHFRVRYQNSTANFTIKSCGRLNGSGEVLKYEKNIIAWWRDNKQVLINAWNERRPTDCTVGAYRE